MPLLRYRFHICLVGFAIATGSALAQTAAASQPSTTIEAVTSSNPLRDGIEVQAGSATVHITALRDDIVRVRIAPTTMGKKAVKVEISSDDTHNSAEQLATPMLIVTFL